MPRLNVPIYGRDTPGISSDFVSQLVERRYRRLVSAHDLLVPQEMSCPDEPNLALEVLAKFSSRATALASLLLRIEDAHVRALSLGNYIEHLVSTTAGAANVYAFLHNCL